MKPQLPIRTSAVCSRQIELAGMLPALTTPRLLGLMGYINNLVGCILIHYGAAQKVNGLYLLNHLRVNAVVELARNGRLSISTPITYTHQYLKQYWPGATNHRPFIRDMRAILSEMALISFDPQLPREEATRQPDGSCKSPPSEYYCIDLCSLVALYELLERKFLSRQNPEANEYGEHESYELDDLPPHRGALMREVFNFLVRQAAYGRVDTDFTSSVPDVELEFFDNYCPKAVLWQRQRLERLEDEDYP